MERHSSTWAALPGPLDIIFPGSNCGLAERIVETGGALISEYFPGTRPHATFFIERDRLQSALADAVVVIETAHAGGTMHTVRFARELNVPLYVTLPPGALERADGELEEVTRGAVALARSGASTIEPDQVAALVDRLGGPRLAAPATNRDAAGSLPDARQ